MGAPPPPCPPPPTPPRVCLRPCARSLPLSPPWRRVRGRRRRPSPPTPSPAPPPADARRPALSLTPAAAGGGVGACVCVWRPHAATAAGGGRGGVGRGGAGRGGGVHGRGVSLRRPHASVVSRAVATLPSAAVGRVGGRGRSRCLFPCRCPAARAVSDARGGSGWGGAWGSDRAPPLRGHRVAARGCCRTPARLGRPSSVPPACPRLCRPLCRPSTAFPIYGCFSPLPATHDCALPPSDHRSPLLCGPRRALIPVAGTAATRAGRGRCGDAADSAWAAGPARGPWPPSRGGPPAGVPPRCGWGGLWGGRLWASIGGGARRGCPRHRHCAQLRARGIEPQRSWCGDCAGYCWRDV